MPTNHIEKIIVDYVQEKSQLGEADINTQSNMITTGLLDSIDFIALIMKLETELAIDIDFSDMDPETFTTIKGLSQFLHAKVAA